MGVLAIPLYLFGESGWIIVIFCVRWTKLHFNVGMAIWRNRLYVDLGSGVHFWCRSINHLVDCGDVFNVYIVWSHPRIDNFVLVFRVSHILRT